MSKVELVVEGDLNALDDASSSESEPEDDNYANNEPPMQFNNNDDEEESLEVFTKAPQKPKVVTEKVKPVAAPKLNEIVNTVKEEPKSSDDIDINFDDIETPDEFGITYKKVNDVKKTTPSKPKVESEVLVDASFDIDAKLQAMKASSTARNDTNDDDDEFGFDSPDNNNSNTSDAIHKALDSVARRETVEHTNELFVDNSDFMISSQSSSNVVTNGPMYQPVDEPILANSGHNHTTNSNASTSNNNSTTTTTTPVKKGSALADAKKAYQDVLEVYGGGMGDQEVLLLDTKAPTSSATTINSKMPLTAQIDKSVKGNVIEEGDEEEEEEEERLESTRQLELVEKTNQLHAEWENVDKPTPTPTTTNNNVSSGNGGVGIVNDDEVFLSFGEASVGTATVECVVSAGYVPIDYKTALTLAKNSNLKRFESQIVISDKTQTSSSSWFGLGRSSDISYPGYTVEDLKLPFLLAQMDYEPALHITMLTNIYYFCLPNLDKSNQVSATGSHWEKIGFQGVDPRTDLNRSMKLLSILQMLEFIETDPNFVRQLHTLSGSADAVSSHLRSSKMDTSWPFMCVAIMFTKESIQALRSGVLNAKCSKYESVMKAINTFHHSCFFEFYRLLTEQPTVHHAVHLAALRKACSENPLKIMNAYRTHLKRPSVTTSKPSADKTVAPPTEILAKFDNLESIDDSKVEKVSSSWSIGGKASKFQVK